ncbi:MAG: alanine--tRNA ligase [Fibrobacteria bacterium]|nr:alanine--tRNA ligase [Fibrobacteria bacterium]
MNSEEIRTSFIQFFEKKAHSFVKSAPVVALDDPTLLFTNAGMNQFKPIFLGENKNNLKRAVNSQKCIRVSGKHNDLEVVGKDTYHHTFFEMLGNWSFGDYYKAEAIEWAWELLTEVWKLPKDRLFVTVYKDDEEAAALWTKLSGLPVERIMRFAEKENFWEMGEVGPCGPCSEIHFDTGDITSQLETFRDPIKGVNGENDRYIEIWNLVFMQYQRMNNGELQPLKDKHVDTGMGFERVCAILQNVKSNYDTDVFTPIIKQIETLSTVPYSPDAAGMPHRVIADHLRALSFAITDGGLPGNEGRGYVLRRILRRASRYARELGQKQAFLYKLVPTLVKTMGAAFPELKERMDFVTQVIQSEEERFMKTLDQGLERFNKAVRKLKEKKGSQLSGKDAFTLYDTYGFPLDLTSLLAEEQGLAVDIAGYNICMKEQNDRARGAAKFDNNLSSDENWTILNKGAISEFRGYESLKSKATVLRYRLDKKELLLVLDKTPFYAESGGQLGDRGIIKTEGAEFQVFDTIKVNDMIVHKIVFTQSEEILSRLSEVEAQVNEHSRLSTMRHHSATHLMQAALQKVLGDHVQQQGSRVGPESLRFDFTHFKALSEEELKQVEVVVNEQIRGTLAVTTTVKDLEEAKASGAMALFGEKYEDKVRVVQMDTFSQELCGGTHVTNTGQIGFFKITSEESIASGVRRIEALTGQQALDYVQTTDNQVVEIRQLLNAKPGKEAKAVIELAGRVKAQEKEMEQLRNQQAASQMEIFLSKVNKINGHNCLITPLGGVGKKELNALTDSLSDKLQNGIAVLTNAQQGNLSIVVLVSKDLCGTYKAGDLVKTLSAFADGRGGGRPDRAQAGSKKPEKEPIVLAEAEKLLKEMLS